MNCIFHRRWSSKEGLLLPKVIFHLRLSSRLSPTERLFHRRLSPPKVVFYRRLTLRKGRLPPKGVFHRRLSSTKGLLPSKVFFQRTLSTTYYNTLVDLTFVRTVNIPNFRLQPIKKKFVTDAGHQTADAGRRTPEYLHLLYRKRLFARLIRQIVTYLPD